MYSYVCCMQIVVLVSACTRARTHVRALGVQLVTVGGWVGAWVQGSLCMCVHKYDLGVGPQLY